MIFTKNVWQSAGIWNGATGKVVGIIFYEGQPLTRLPECVVVDFGESYTGPPLFGNEDNGIRVWVPIYPEDYEWYTSRIISNSTSETVT